jgi:hypothetical protein
MKLPQGRMRLVWSREDRDELLAVLERHADEAIQLAKESHPATRAKALLEPEPENPEAPLAPVHDIFTGRRIS